MNPVAYDIDMAKDICKELPLDDLEGIWIYPEDHVSVLVLKDEVIDRNSLPTYSISVVNTTDARLHPGEVIGKLHETAKEREYRIELFTERKNELLLKPKTCLATLSSAGDTFLFKKQNSFLKGRLNLNFSRLLPGFWKMISTGISTSNSSNKNEPSVGMVKIYPSYDGNGSSRRKVRYL